MVIDKILTSLHLLALDPFPFNMTPSRDEMDAWVQRIRASDEEAFAKLFRSLHASLLSYTRSIVADRADDIVQDVFIQLWEKRASVDAQPSIRAYLFTAVRHRALNQVRDETRRSQLVREMPHPSRPASPEREAAMSDLRRKLHAWIADLPPRQREALELSRFSGLTYREIAAVMDISPRTVETHIRRAVDDIRSRLRTYQPDLLQK